MTPRSRRSGACRFTTRSHLRWSFRRRLAATWCRVPGRRISARDSRFTGLYTSRYERPAVRFASAPFEGRMRATLNGSWARERQNIDAGALFVPIAQPAARLAMHLLEPQAPDSFAAWGFFNACFEQKEHFEPYVAEQIARSVLAEGPQLQQAFARRLEEDADFAANPAARLEFFLRRHASWDTRLNLYPVFRVDELLASASPVRS
jgi:hypothetical protein